MIDKAVFSYWGTSGNMLKSATNWGSPKFHLYSCVLATHKAKEWFSEVELVTDSESAKIFEKLELPITSMNTCLDELSGFSKELWALGKIKAYEIQQKPFVHIDSDAILYLDLPIQFKKAGIFAQNKEDAGWFDHSYRGQYNHLTKNGKLPESWGSCEYAVCMGIYGVNDMEYNRQYTKEAFDLVINNHDLIVETGCAGLYCVVFEQYMASAVAERMGKEITYMSDPYDANYLERLGYIHIWGEKKNPKWMANAEKIVKREYPKHYELVNQLI